MQVLGHAGIARGPPPTHLLCLPPLGDVPTGQLIARVICVLRPSVQFSLCLTWVSEIINPAKTDVGFGRVTDIFLRSRSGAVRSVLSGFVVALWPGTKPRNLICDEHFTKERSLSQNCITLNLHFFCCCSVTVL